MQHIMHQGRPTGAPDIDFFIDFGSAREHLWRHMADLGALLGAAGPWKALPNRKNQSHIWQKHEKMSSISRFLKSLKIERIIDAKNDTL